MDFNTLTKCFISKIYIDSLFQDLHPVLRAERVLICNISLLYCFNDSKLWVHDTIIKLYGYWTIKRERSLTKLRRRWGLDKKGSAEWTAKFENNLHPICQKESLMESEHLLANFDVSKLDFNIAVDIIKVLASIV